MAGTGRNQIGKKFATLQQTKHKEVKATEEGARTRSKLYGKREVQTVQTLCSPLASTRYLGFLEHRQPKVTANDGHLPCQQINVNPKMSAVGNETS